MFCMLYKRRTLWLTESEFFHIVLSHEEIFSLSDMMKANTAGRIDHNKNAVDKFRINDE